MRLAGRGLAPFAELAEMDAAPPARRRITVFSVHATVPKLIYSSLVTLSTLNTHSLCFQA